MTFLDALRALIQFAALIVLLGTLLGLAVAYLGHRLRSRAVEPDWDDGEGPR